MPLPTYLRRAAAALAIISAVAVAACASDAPRPTPPRAFTIFFGTDSADLTSDAQTVLDAVAAEVRQTSATGVGLVGYSSPGGTAAANLRLAEQRIASVETALRTRGVPPDIIVRVPQGQTDVIGPAIEGQRVEITVSRAAAK